MATSAPPPGAPRCHSASEFINLSKAALKQCSRQPVDGDAAFAKLSAYHGRWATDLVVANLASASVRIPLELLTWLCCCHPVFVCLRSPRPGSNRTHSHRQTAPPHARLSSNRKNMRYACGSALGLWVSGPHSDRQRCNANASCLTA